VLLLLFLFIIYILLSYNTNRDAGYASVNHRRPRFRRRRSTCMEQSSSRSAPIPDIYYF